MLLDEIIPYILQIDRKKFNIFYRPKASPSKQLRKFFDLHRITVVSDPSFYESLINNSIRICIGTYSTCLYESFELGVPSLVLKTRYDFGRHLWEDNYCVFCDSPHDINLTLTSSLSNQQTKTNL